VRTAVLARTRVAIVVAAVLASGALGAEHYARLIAPYYAIAARCIAAPRPWTVTDLRVVDDDRSPGIVLRLQGAVRATPSDTAVAATTVSRMHVGAVIETPLVLWTVLALWPVSTPRMRWRLLAAGIPLWVALEILATVVPLLGPLAAASAVLAGAADPLTLWDHWSRFLETGGRFALPLAAGMLLAASARMSARRVAGDDVTVQQRR